MRAVAGALSPAATRGYRRGVVAVFEAFFLVVEVLVVVFFVGEVFFVPVFAVAFAVPFFDAGFAATFGGGGGGRGSGESAPGSSSLALWSAGGAPATAR